MKRLPIAAILASTALIPAAFAQNTSTAEDIADNEICAALVAYVDENDTDESGITAERADAIAVAKDPAACREAYMTAEAADVAVSADIKVAVPDPQVNVEQAAPQVSVQQPKPDVNVTPGRPVVTVNQAEPVVRVVTTPPTVTIDMPKPEILVEIPDPTVDVAMAEPRVTVNQPQPVVNVKQGEVKLNVGDKSVDQPEGEAKVDVSQSNPTVSIDRAEGSNIDIAEVQPDVRYNAAKPRVEVTESGKADITFNQSGEANVKFRRMSADETRAAAADRQQMAAARTDAATPNAEAPAATADAAADPAADKLVAVDAKPANDATSANPPRSILAGELLDKSVIGAEGDEIGEVDQFVTLNGETFLVVGVGGLLGLGEKQIAIPLMQASFREDEFHVPTLTEDAAEEMPEFDAARYTAVRDEQNIDVMMN